MIEKTKPDIILETTEDEILKEVSADPRFGKGYHEGAILFRKMCREDKEAFRGAAKAD